MSYKRLLPALAIWAVLVAVATAAPMKALIVDGQNNHRWQVTTPPLKQLLEETGLFTVDVATSPPRGQDMSTFKPKFAPYDLVVLNYTGASWPEETNTAFEKFVADGGGVVVFHAASNAFAKWKEFNEITGLGGWGRRNEKDGPYARWRDGKIVRDTTPGRGGGHGPMQPFQLVIREPNHPITKGLPAEFMHVPDELYGWLRGPAKNLTVLATAFAPKAKGGSGEHEPLLFTVAYGDGRVFQNAMGHTPKELKSVAFIVPFQRGAEWAACGNVTQAVPKDIPGPDKANVRE